jgi:hypothetical protein
VDSDVKVLAMLSIIAQWIVVRARCRSVYVFVCEAPMQHEPSKDAFRYPTVRKGFEAFDIDVSTYDVDVDAFCVKL